jgi:hypothetical protein
MLYRCGSRPSRVPVGWGLPAGTRHDEGGLQRKAATARRLGDGRAIVWRLKYRTRVRV